MTMHEVIGQCALATTRQYLRARTSSDQAAASTRAIESSLVGPRSATTVGALASVCTVLIVGRAVPEGAGDGAGQAAAA